MILNGYSVLAAFAAALRSGLGLFLLFAVVVAWRRWRRRARHDGLHEQRVFLTFSLAATLVGLAVASWPLLYLVLQSYVPMWPGVMCIQGVTRIGTGSTGSAAHLPGLLAFLEFAKPALVFVAGTWLVLHLANRRSSTGTWTGRVLATLLVLGFLAVFDGTAELAYLLIPKQEKFLAAGCCSLGAQLTASVGPSPVALFPSAAKPGAAWMSHAFIPLAAASIVFVSLALVGRKRNTWLAASLGGALLSLPAGWIFLALVAAPAFLRLPDHHCAYCLVASAPESLVGVVLVVLGTFGIGWACVARWMGGSTALSRRLLRAARFGLVGALIMLGGRMAIS